MKPDLTNLENLHDVIAPSPVPFWPPAPGWYFLLGTFVCVLLFMMIRLIHHWQQQHYRREALTILEATSLSPSALATLLKRTALSVWSREKVASLTGSDWLSFLDEKGKTQDFTKGIGTQLESAVYDSKIASSINEEELLKLQNLVRHWIKNHHV